MFSGRESGNIAMIMLVVNVALLSVVVLNKDRQTTNFKGKSIKIDRVTSDAQQMNLSAISYLNATLERDKAGKAVLEVKDKKIAGPSTPGLDVIGGKAYFHNLAVASLSGTEMEQAMIGKIPLANSQGAASTELEILAVDQDDTFDIYDVRATSSIAMPGSKRANRPVSTTGRIKVAIVPPCEGLFINDYCYYYGAGGANCEATCTAENRLFDADGTNLAANSGAVCHQVLDFNSVPAGAFMPRSAHIGPDGLGCKYYPGFGPTQFNRGRWMMPGPNSTDSFPDVRRVCACRNP